jgi:cysteine desulfurase/selenocysteine lyase
VTTVARAPALDVASIREDFPILSQQVNGRRLVYLDNAATTQKPRQVIDALVRFYETSNANVHRGIHTLSMRASTQYEGARHRTAAFVGATRPEEIVFTRNATEAINLVARAWGDANVGEGDEIVLTLMEHHSNIVPWQQLAARRGAVLRYAGLTPDGRLDLDGMRALIGPRTRLVAIVHASNVLGTINPVAEVAEMAHAAGALVLVDGAQSAPHLPIDAIALGCDFFALSAHKMLGPTGVGALWARHDVLDAMEPFLGGGSMIERVECDRSTWALPPDRFEAGTPNVADVIAFATALDYLDALGLGAVREHEIEIAAYALDRLLALPSIRIHGPIDPVDRCAVLSFGLEGIHPHDISTILDEQGIAIRAGHHCAQPLMRFLDEPATSRASFYIYNGTDDVDALVEGLADVRRIFG